MKLGEKKKFLTSRLAFSFPTRLTGNNFLLKGGLIKLFNLRVMNLSKLWLGALSEIIYPLRHNWGHLFTAGICEPLKGLSHQTPVILVRCGDSELRLLVIASRIIATVTLFTHTIVEVCFFVEVPALFVGFIDLDAAFVGVDKLTCRSICWKYQNFFN